MKKEELKKTLREMLSNKTHEKEFYTTINDFELLPHYEIGEEYGVEFITGLAKQLETDTDKRINKVVILQNITLARSYYTENVKGSNIKFYRSFQTEKGMLQEAIESFRQKIEIEDLTNKPSVYHPIIFLTE